MFRSPSIKKGADWPSAKALSSWRPCVRSEVDQRAFIGALVHSCGWTEGAKAMSPQDAIGLYNPRTLSIDPWVIEREWVDWLCNEQPSMTGRARAV